MRIFSWGCNSHGQLGQGIESEQVNEPSPVSGDFDVESVVGGGRHTVVVTRSGKIFSCGDNSKGQQSKDRTTKCILSLALIHLKVKIVKVSCGWDFNLALSDEGQVYGWGGNSFGQLGLPRERTLFCNEPVITFREKAIDIGAGLRHSVIVTEKGFVFSAGFARKGQLGIQFPPDKKIANTFSKVESVNRARKISCGENHCILSTEKGLYSWGDNRFGQLGVDPSCLSASGTPVRIAYEIKDSKVKTLVSGWSHNAILTNEGEVITWGRNDYGQLGERRVANWNPKNVSALTDTKQVALGSNHGLALTNDGRLLSWGWNEHGNCGTRSIDNVYEPIPLRNLHSKPCLVGAGSAHSFYCSN